MDEHNESRFIHPRGEVTAGWCASAAYMTALIFITVVGNLAVIVFLARLRRKAMHYPLFSLASADLMVGTCVLPFSAARELFIFSIDPKFCAFWESFDALCCTSSIISLCVLGWERWSGITQPLRQARRIKLSKILAGLVWPVSIAIAMPAAFVPSPIDAEDNTVKACSANTNFTYAVTSATFSFYIPSAVMVFMYVRIMSVLSRRPPLRAHRGGPPKNCTPSPINGKEPGHKVIRIISDMETIRSKIVRSPAPAPCSSPSGLAARQNSATKTILILMLIFFVCWLPFFIMLPYDAVCNDCVSELVWFLCTWLGYTNSALNPIAYGLRSEPVRKALHGSLSWTSSQRNSDAQPLQDVRTQDA